MNKICTCEERLLTLFSRLTFTDDTVDEIGKIFMNENVDWYEFYKLCLYHKTVTLCFMNCRRLFPDVVLPKYLRDMIFGMYFSIKRRNELYYKEMKLVEAHLDKKGITVIPVKGIYMAKNIYNDLGLRYLGDADYLIEYSNIKKLGLALKEIEYIQGKYNYDLNQISPISRAEEIKWKRFMSNLHPFIKICELEDMFFYKCDFRYALDQSLNKEPVSELITDYKHSGKYNHALLLTHLCTHFYDEAIFEISEERSKDLNIIKLCDIREFIMKFISDQDFADFIRFIKKHGLQKQVYFTLFFLDIIYGDGYEVGISEKLQIEADWYDGTYYEGFDWYNTDFRETMKKTLLSCGKKVNI